MSNNKTPKISFDDYVSNNIKKKLCNGYKENQKTKKCYCGREEGKHKHGTEKNFVKTNAYGEIQLEGFELVFKSKPKYIRACVTNSAKEDPVKEDLAKEDLAKHLYEILINYWNLDKPKLIISINGAAKKMIPLNNSQKVIFKCGLRNVAKYPSTWIITGGFGCGVSQLTGEAAKDYYICSDKNLTLIGIGSWGATCNRELLTKEGVAVYKNSETVKKGMAVLDPYHNAFILYDGGNVQEFGQEIDFRTKFEAWVAKEAQCSVIQVIVEGGIKTIETAAKALENKIPIVLMKGSKRAADVMCEVIEYDGNEIPNDLFIKYEKELDIRENEKTKFKENLELIKKNYEKVKIFSMSNFGKDLESAILEAAFITASEATNEEDTRKSLNEDEKKFKKILELSMLYNRSDVAEKELFQKKSNFDVKILKESIENPLKEGKWEFVRLFLVNGLTIESFLNNKLLNDLYSQKIIEALGDVLWNVLKNYNGLEENKENEKMLNRKDITMKVSKNLLKLSASETTNEDDNKNSLSNANNKKNAVHPSKSASETTNKDDDKNSLSNVANKDKFSHLDLLVWALLTHQFQMAKIFWENGKDHIGTALVASVICKSMARTSSKQNEIEMARRWEEEQSIFEKLAISILNEAYCRDRIKSHFLLIRNLPFLNGYSCLKIGFRNEMIDFIFHNACQTRLNTIWFGGISPHISRFKILINLLVFPFTKRIIFPQARHECENSNSQTDYQNEVSFKTFREGQQSSKKVTCCNAILTYYKAPIIRCIVNYISYVIFLIVFSYLMLVELQPRYDIKDIKVNPDQQIEIIIYIYFLGYIVEEINKLVNRRKNLWRDWSSSLWNLYNLIWVITFVIAVILRYLKTIDFVHARTAYATALSMSFFRLMPFYYADKSLGPKVFMIRRMLKDYYFFLTIYLIAVFAYGTFAQSLLFPNTPLSGFLLVQLFSDPYWQTFGELNLEYVGGNENRNNMTAQKNNAVYVAFGLFMLISNILLLNLLIAMFGNTYSKVEENSRKIWAFIRCKLIEDFYYLPYLPPPLNMIELIVTLIYHRCSTKNKPKDSFIKTLESEEYIKISFFEKICMEACLEKDPLFDYNKASKEGEEQSYNSNVSNDSNLKNDAENFVCRSKSFSEKSNLHKSTDSNLQKDVAENDEIKRNVNLPESNEKTKSTPSTSQNYGSDAGSLHTSDITAEFMVDTKNKLEKLYVKIRRLCKYQKLKKQN